MADKSNAEREQQKLKLENLASEAVLKFEEHPDSSYYYNEVIELVNQLDDSNEQKKGCIRNNK